MYKIHKNYENIKNSIISIQNNVIKRKFYY